MLLLLRHWISPTEESFMSFSNISPAPILQELSNMGPFCRVQSFRKTAPVCIPRVVTSPARNPASSWGLLHGLQFQPGPCSSLGFPQATATFIYFSAYACAEAWCPPQDAVWMSATYHGLPWAAWGQPVSPCVSPHMVSREGDESL